MPEPLTREALLEKTRSLHDIRYGTDHCDRKYLMSCSRFAELTLEAGAALRATPTPATTEENPDD